MDLLDSANELRREAGARRRALAVVLAVAVACGALVFLRPGLPPETRQYEIWHADGQLLVDTSDSQVVDARAIGIETLAIRAILLGNLIATSPLRDGIAQRAGLDPDELEVTPPASSTPEVLPPPPVTSDLPDDEAMRLTVSTDPSLPIVRVRAQAPSAAGAEGLVDAALAETAEYVESARGEQALPDQRQLVVSALGPATARSETRGPGFGTALFVALFVAVLGTAGVLAVPLLGRRERGGAQPATPNGHSPEGVRRVKRAAKKASPAGRRSKKRPRAAKPRSPR
ncbi:MAG TPA: hypothetical protein VIL04_09190 [Solirubrobacterales bacterium]|jgi:hypothetical protein